MESICGAPEEFDQKCRGDSPLTLSAQNTGGISISPPAERYVLRSYDDLHATIFFVVEEIITLGSLA